MKHTDPNFKLRFPPDVHAYLKREAKRQERTMSAHIIFLLRREMDEEQAKEKK